MKGEIFIGSDPSLPGSEKTVCSEWSRGACVSITEVAPGAPPMVKVQVSDAIERSKSAAWDLYESQFASVPKPHVNHNLKNYGQFVDGNLESCMDFEKRWLCNRISKIHGKGFALRKNHRLCRADSNGDPSKRYIARQANCGGKQPHDVKLVNALTGNVFWYGFDHGR